MKRIYYLLLMAIVALLLLPLPAFAQSISQVFPVSPNDISKTMFLDKVFGPLTGASSSSPFGTMIGIFNAGILSLGGVYLLYIYISGTAQGAHDGTFLGKRWSGLWTPIRMLVGTVLVFPSLNGGFCLAQWLVVWLTLQGIGFADQVWSAYTSSLGSATVSSLPIGNQPYQIARQLFLNNVCVDLMNQAIGQTNGSTASYTSDEVADLQAMYGTTKFEASGASNGKVFNIDYKVLVDGEDDSSFLDKTMGSNSQTVCGNAYVPMPPTASNTQAPQSSNGLTDVLNNNVNMLSAVNQVTTQIAQVHETALVQLQAQAAQLASQYVANPSPSIATQLNSLASSYTSQLQNVQTGASSTINTASQQLSKGIQDDGWILAGANYYKIARLQNAMSSALYGYPTVLASAYMQGKDIKDDDGNNAVLIRMLKDVRGQYIKAAQVTADARIANSEMAQYDVGLNNTQDESKFSTLISKIWGDENVNPASIMKIMGQNPEGNPIVLVTQMGQISINTGGIIFGVGTLVGAFSPEISMIAFALGAILVGMGVLAAFFIPLIPFFIWIACVFSWVVLFGEAMIAAPLWGITHLSPEGMGSDGVAGQASLGWKLIITLTLRPVLMIFGFVAANIIFTTFSAFYNDCFGFAFADTTDGQNSWVRLIGVMAGFGMYIYGLNKLMHQCFGLIHAVPDKIMRWMGGESSGATDHSKDMTGAAMAGTYAVSKGIGAGAKLASKASHALGAPVVSKVKSMFDSIADRGGDKDNGGHDIAMALQQGPGPDGGSGGGSLSSGSVVGEYEDKARSASKEAYGHQKQAMARNPDLARAVNYASSDKAKEYILNTAVQNARENQKAGKSLEPFERSILRYARAKEQEANFTEQANLFKERNQESE